MKQTDNPPPKKIAVKALNQFKKRLYLYPSIAGVGLGRDNNNRFVVHVYVYIDTPQVINYRRCRIPRLISVKDPNNGGKIVKVPTLIEKIGEAELL